MYYFETKEKKYLLLSSVALSAYILCHNSFLGILPFIAFLPLIYGKKADLETLKVLLEWRLFALPAITLIFLITIHLGAVITTGITCYDLIGHTFSGSKTALGFYLLNTIPGIIANIGIPLLIMALLSIPFGIRDIIQMKKKASIFILALSYTIPYIILIPGSATSVWAQVSHGLIWWVVYIALIIPEVYDSIKSMINGTILKYAYGVTSSLILIIVIMITLLGTFENVHHQNIYLEDDFGQQIFKNGVYKPNNGVKTAGYWIRENTQESVIVFSDASGGQGIEPPVASYYFNRRIVGLKDGKLDKVYELLAEKINETDVIVAEPRNEEQLKNVLQTANETFFLTVRVWNKDKELLRIYSRIEMPLQKIKVSDSDSLYDMKYNHLYDYTNKRFVKEEQNQEGYFKERCSKTRLTELYSKLGLID
jgi:hypothetical protein